MGVDLGIEPVLLEEVVVRAVRRRRDAGDPAPEQAYHRETDRLYHLAPERREAAFAAHHRRLFRELGLEAPLRAVADDHAAALAALPSLAVVRALRRDDEGADLGAAASGVRPGVLRILGARLLGDEPLIPFLHHELMHLADLIDPGFGHDPGALDAVSAHRRRLVQARYRLLWAITVDGRLARAGRPALADRGERRAQLAAFLTPRSPAQIDGIFQALWAGPRPAHATLLALADAGAGGGGGQPGAPCPLCGFPTHRWARDDGAAMADVIRADVAGWRPEDGLCQHCRERYGLLAHAAR